MAFIPEEQTLFTVVASVVSDKPDSIQSHSPLLASNSLDPNPNNPPPKKKRATLNNAMDYQINGLHWTLTLTPIPTLVC